MSRYFIYWPIWLVVVVVRYPLSIVAVLFFSSKDKLTLTWMKWLETIDNDLTGDSGWKAEHLIGADPLSVLNRVRWLWRNGGNLVNYMVLGCRADLPWIARQDRSLYFWHRPDGYWLYRRFLPFVGAYKLELYFGWGLLGPQLGRCKFVCQIRIKRHS